MISLVILGLASDTLKLSLGSASAFLLCLAGLTLIKAVRDPERKSRRCRKCRYLIPTEGDMACPECGWIGRKEKQFYFRHFARHLVFLALLLAGLSATAYYGLFIEFRANQLNESLAKAWVPTTWHIMSLKIQDGSNDDLIFERLEDQAWGWQEDWLHTRYESLCLDPEQPVARVRQSLTYERDEEDWPTPSPDDVDPLLAQIARGDSDLTLDVMNYLARATFQDTRIRDAAIGLLETPILSVWLHASASFVLGQQSLNDAHILKQWIDDERGVLEIGICMQGVLIQTVCPLALETEDVDFTLTAGYRYVLDLSVAPPGALGQPEAATAIARRLGMDAYYGYINEPAPASWPEIEAIYDKLTTSKPGVNGFGPFEQGWKYEGDSLWHDEPLNKIHIGLMLKLIERDPDDPRITVLLSQFLRPEFGYGNGTIGGGMAQLIQQVEVGRLDRQTVARLGRELNQALIDLHRLEPGDKPFVVTEKENGGYSFSNGILMPDGIGDTSPLNVVEMWKISQEMMALDDEADPSQSGE